MPGINGIDVLKLIRRIEMDRHVTYAHQTKVILASALSGLGHISKAFEEKYDDYLIKSFDSWVIDKQMRKITHAA